MPTFTKLKPSEVVLGRGRANLIKRRPFEEAIRKSDAGAIQLEKGDNPNEIKRLLRQASQATGVKVRSSWENERKERLLWKRTGLTNN